MRTKLGLWGMYGLVFLLTGGAQVLWPLDSPTATVVRGASIGAITAIVWLLVSDHIFKQTLHNPSDNSLQ